MQLRAAIDAGLLIPPTRITNDPVSAKAFVKQLGRDRTVYKTFLASTEWWRETRILRPEEADLLDLVRLAPVIFQQYVPTVADIRVTVVGERLIATAIKAAGGGYDIDYRMDMDGATFKPTELRPATEQGIKTLMKRLSCRAHRAAKVLTAAAVRTARSSDDCSWPSARSRTGVRS